jgi:hypothetical protein
VRGRQLVRPPVGSAAASERIAEATGFSAADVVADPNGVAALPVIPDDWSFAVLSGVSYCAAQRVALRMIRWMFSSR